MSPWSGSDLHFLALNQTPAYNVRPVHHMSVPICSAVGAGSGGLSS